LSFVNDKDDERRRRNDAPVEGEAPPATRPRARKKQAESPELGKALRTVYQRTIDEDIPPEMLDLLGKLG
jgi:Anti-sigma factor NepR